MNDLLSTASAALGLNQSSSDWRENSMDLESGFAIEMTGVDTEKNLAGFFEEVGLIKNELEKVKQLLLKLQEANEESKSITKAQAMKALKERMDKDVEEVLKKARFIKAKLEALDKANAANRKIHGYEQGSSTDRTRTAITNGLRKTLKDVMGDFQLLRQKMMSEYKETIERRYYTVTGNRADEETIDRMIATGESESFLQKAIQEQGRGQIIETIREIQERHDAVMDIEKNLLELHQIFLDMSVLVEAQGEELNNIEAAVKGASSFVERGTKQLQTARRLQKNTRKWTCFGIILLLIIILIILLPVLLVNK